MYLNVWCNDDDCIHLMQYNGEPVSVISELSKNNFGEMVYECRLQNGDYENIPDCFLSAVPPDAYLF